MTRGGQVRCRPVRPEAIQAKTIEAVGAAAGAASRNSEQTRAQDKEYFEIECGEVKKQIMADKDIETEDEESVRTELR